MMKTKTLTILGIIQAFVAIGAIPAGYSMIVEPDGSDLGMTTDILAGSPFTNFFIPGLFLLIVNGLFNLINAILCFIKFKHASLMGFVLGVALIVWVFVQVYSIGLTHFLQPTYFVIGIIEIILSISIMRNLKPGTKQTES